MSSFVSSKGNGPPFQGRSSGPIRARCEVLQYRKIGK